VNKLKRDRTFVISLKTVQKVRVEEGFEQELQAQAWRTSLGRST
jgi:hypothetical protein